MIDTDVTEDNIVSRISTQCPDFGNNVVSAGDMSAIQSAAERDPACFVLFESESYEGRELDGSQVGTLMFQVVIMSTSMRGQKSGRKGDLGTYKLSKKVQEALRNYDPVNNTTVSANHPMWLSDMVQYPDTDTAKYFMVMRFACLLDSFIS